MKKLLISVLALVMSVSVALGLTACSSGPSDEEIATKAIDTVNVLYVDSAASTPDDYTVIGQARVDDKLYPIDWSVSPDSAKEYAKVGAMDETTKMVTIDITRTTVDVEYTLKASITVGSVTKTTEFKHSIPKKSSEDAVTASLDLTARDNRTSLDLDNNEQVWKQNGVTLTNSGNVADYVPIRLYKNTTVSIEMENAKIIHIDFHSAQGFDDSPYPEYLKTSLENSDLPIKGEVTVSEDGLTFGVDFETPQEVVTFKTTAGQCRLTSIDVEAIERDPNEHVHKWTYEHVANTWTHTATCTAEGCDVKTKTEACTPKLNVCECGYTYTAKEIVDALFALETGKSLPGTYSLTGLVTKVTELDTSNYKNVTFDMTVEGQTVTVFRAKGSHYADVREGGYATVNGELLDYNGTKEFTQGGSVVEFSDERTAQQKVDAALKALADTFTVTKAGETELPASTENDVTFTWATTDQTYTIANNKINVTALPAADATVTATVTATCGTETVTNNTKEVTVTIKAEASEPEDTYFEITPSNFNGTLAGLTASDLEENTAHPEEFTIKPNGYIKTNSFGHRIAKVVTEVYGSYDNMKMYAATSADASKEVKSVVEKPEDLREIITYTFEGGTDDFYFVNPSTYSVQMYSIKIYYESSGGGEDPQPSGTLELTRETLFAGITGTGYTPYNGTHTVGNVQVTTSGVLGTDNYYDGTTNYPYGFTVLQFRKTDGTLSLKGTFTKIVIVLATAYAYDDADKPIITAGTTTLTAGSHTEADANFSQGGNAWKFYTIEYAVTTTGEQTITFKGAAHAVYVKSITLTGTASQGGTVDPDPQPTDPGIKDENGTITFNVGNYAAAQKWENATRYGEVALGENVTVTATGTAVGEYGLNTGKYYTSNKSWRIYQNEKCNLTFTAKTGYEIVSIKITYKGDKNGVLISGETQYPSGNVITVNGTTATFTVAQTTVTTDANGNIQITEIEVVYKTSGGSVEPQPQPTGKTATYDAPSKGYANNTKVTIETEGDVTFTFSKGSGSSDPAYYTDKTAVRFYPNNTLTVSVANGYYISKIVITFAATGDSTNNALTANKGTFATDTWTGTTQTVVLTSGGASGHRKIVSIEVTYVATTHVHQYNVAHDEGAFTHTGTCNVAGCYDTTYSEPCTLTDNKCSACNTTYTEDEIKTALFALTAGQSLPGNTYQLTGKVLRIDTAYDSNYGNVTFTMKIGDHEVQAYRTSGEKAATVKPGDSVTVKGGLTNYNGTYQFSAGAILSLTEGTLTAEEKVSEVKRWLTLPDAVDNVITLPALPDWASGVTLTAASNKTGSLSVDGTKLTLIPGAQDEEVKVTMTIACNGATSATKEFTVKVPAKLPDGATSATYDPSTKYTENTKVTTETVGDVTLKFDKNGGTDPQYYTSGTAIRAYAKNKITVSVPAGKVILKITITFGTSGDGSNEITAEGGTYANGVWTGSAQSVTFTIGGTSGQRRIAKIEVVYAPAPAAAANVAPVALLPGKEF